MIESWSCCIFSTDFWEDVSPEKSGGDANLSDVPDTSYGTSIETYVEEFFVSVIF